jgi:GDP-4-dehydro-6-deoxy-D-mannose reductase
MLVVSSSAVYGYPGNAAIPETTPQKPLSEYGVSKMAQDALALMYHQLRGSKVVVARPFNLTGPDQPGSFVCGRIVNQAAEIGQGKKPALELLEIRSSRDFLDVRDAVKGYWALVSHPEFLQECSGRAFNIGSGKACSISGLISLIEEITGKHYPVRLPPVPPRVPLLFQQSDNTRITATTGWTPRIPLKETLRDMLLAAERRISAG